MSRNETSPKKSWLYTNRSVYCGPYPHGPVARLQRVAVMSVVCTLFALSCPVILTSLTSHIPWLIEGASDIILFFPSETFAPGYRCVFIFNKETELIVVAQLI